jgi:hypothetical protein
MDTAPWIYLVQNIHISRTARTVPDDSVCKHTKPRPKRFSTCNIKVLVLHMSRMLELILALNNRLQGHSITVLPPVSLLRQQYARIV